MTIIRGEYSDVEMSLGKDAFINPSKNQINASNARTYRKFAYFPRLDTMFIWDIESEYDGLPAHCDAIEWLKCNINNVGIDECEDVILGRVYDTYYGWKTDFHGAYKKPENVRQRLFAISSELGLPNLPDPKIFE